MCGTSSKILECIKITVVTAESLEAAEMIKLINNSYRDLRFAFSNSVALICDKYNIDAHTVINQANDGYPRDPIASPSPGVGGCCLTKDPLLFACTDWDSPASKLVTQGRKVNDACIAITKLEQYAKNCGKSLSSLHIFWLG